MNPLDKSSNINTDSFSSTPFSKPLSKVQKANKVNQFGRDLIKSAHYSDYSEFFHTTKISPPHINQRASKEVVFSEIGSLEIEAALFRIKNVYYFDRFSPTETLFKSILDEDIFQIKQAFTAKNYMKADFDSKKAFVPKDSAIPVGTEVEVEGLKLKIEYLTEEEEKALSNDLETHINSEIMMLDEVKNEPDEKSKTKSKKLLTNPKDTSSVHARKKIESAAKIQEHQFVSVNLKQAHQNAKIEKKHKEKHRLEEEIEKEMLTGEIRNEKIFNDNIARTTINENILKTDTLKQRIGPEGRHFRKPLGDHRLAVIPTTRD